MRVCEGHPDDMGQIVSEDYLEMRNSLQCAEICLLPGWLIRIILPRLYSGGKVFYACDSVAGNHDTAQRLDIQPFVGGALHCTVVEVESVVRIQ